MVGWFIFFMVNQHQVNKWRSDETRFGNKSELKKALFHSCLTLLMKERRIEMKQRLKIWGF